MSPPTHPRLRNTITGQLDPDDNDFVLLFDGLRLSRQLLRMHRDAVGILELLDGTRTITDLQAALLPRMGGVFLPSGVLETLVAKLDEACFLESDRMAAEREAFLRNPIREPVCIGTYPEKPEQLRAQLNSQFVRRGGPGKPDAHRGDDGLRGALIPHIDYGRGGHVYAWGFKEVVEKAQADVFVILATSHYSRERFILTRKDFRTPFGIAETDKDYVNRLATYYGPEVFTDELAHWPEHSIELHVVFLQHCLAGKRPFKIVPLLVGNMQDSLETDTPPERLPDVERMIRALRQAEAECGGRVFYLSSGDLAHVGPKFGDPQPVHDQQLDWSKKQDHALLECMEQGNRPGFFGVLRDEMDQRRICGYPPTYLLMSVLEPESGQLLAYDQYVEPTGHESVSFASLTFYKRNGAP